MPWTATHRVSLVYSGARKPTTLLVRLDDDGATASTRDAQPLLRRAGEDWLYLGARPIASIRVTGIGSAGSKRRAEGTADRRRTVRLTPDEDAEIVRRAAREGLGVSDWMRERLLGPE